ncbi:ATP-binding protein [Flavobacterium sp.]|jgi:signal transduction histidine kinase|uniref:GAF domain-containing sensor histidine kinase n=1 Tax=Flavobacterium sp. TaxID=239 RepID=UPI0037C1129D
MDKDQIINQQLRLQQLLISISTEYINADLQNIDGLINNSLQKMGEFVEADRSYIFSYNLTDNTTNNTHEWCAPGIEPEIQNLQNIPVEYIPQWLEAHKKNEAFYIQDLSKLPDDGEFGLKAILEPQGIQSLIAIPMIKTGELIGFVGFDSVKKLFDYSENEKNILFVFANMLVNVIQRKENEERINEQEEKKEILLQNLEKKNQALNEYAHVVSHDLKAPLRSINTLISWFKEDNAEILDKKNKQSLDFILSIVEKMDLLIKGILVYSTIDKLENEDRTIELTILIDEVIRTIHVPNHIEIVFKNEMPKVYGNDFRFKQLFQNLIQNSIKFNDKENGFVEIGSNENENEIEFYIKDNGIGINERYQSKIFDLFSKLENNDQSSGIGLSIVKKIIDLYGGKIWLESQEAIGTTFYFILPKK